MPHLARGGNAREPKSPGRTDISCAHSRAIPWHHDCSTLRGLAPGRRRRVNENDHPKGALVFMLVYLALLAFMWTNLYLKLWTR